jgi:iron complex transport system substrate-binding protein
VIVVMPCGYGLDKVVTELHLLTQRPGWNELPAVKNKRVFLTDANAYFSRPGPRIAQGIEQLAQMLHPDLFPAERPDWERVD